MLSIGASNSHRSTVLSGDPAALDAVLERLEARSVFCRRVQVDVASHSPQTEPLLGALREALDGIAPRACDGTTLLSTVTGEPVDGTLLDAAYWARNLREPVRLSTAVQRLLAEGGGAFVEIGPHPLLLPSIEQDADRHGTQVSTVGTMRRGMGESLAFHGALSAMHVGGYRVDWRAAFPDSARPTVLPAYPWQRVRHWYEPPAGPDRNGPRGERLLGDGVASSTDADTWLWPVELPERALEWLRDHRVRGSAILPAAAFVSMVFEAAAARLGSHGGHEDLEVAALSLDAVLPIGEARRGDAQLALSGGRDGAARFRVSSRDAGDEPWRVHASGRVRTVAARAEVGIPSATLDGDGSDAAHYARMDSLGLDYGPAFRAVVAVATVGGGRVARLALPGSVDPGRHALHPVLLDAGLQVAVAAACEADPGCDPGTTYVPVGASAIRWRGRRPLGVAARVHATCRADPGDPQEPPLADLRWIGDDGATCIEIEGLRLARMPAERRPSMR